MKTFLLAVLISLAQLTAFGQDAPATPERILLWANHAPIGGGGFQAADVEAKYLELPSGCHGLNGYRGPMWERGRRNLSSGW